MLSQTAGCHVTRCWRIGWKARPSSHDTHTHAVLTILNGHKVSEQFPCDGCCISRKNSLTTIFRSSNICRRSCEIFSFTIPQSELSHVVKCGLRGQSIRHQICYPGILLPGEQNAPVLHLVQPFSQQLWNEPFCRVGHFQTSFSILYSKSIDPSLMSWPSILFVIKLLFSHDYEQVMGQNPCTFSNSYKGEFSFIPLITLILY